MIYILIGLCVIGTLTGFKIGSKISRDKMVKSLNKGTGRMGIITYSYSGYQIQTKGVIEVEELEVAGDLTKIIIHNVIPDRGSSPKSRNGFLEKWGGNDWVKTNSIIWYDNNTQMLRDHKIEEILKK